MNNLQRVADYAAKSLRQEFGTRILPCHSDIEASLWNCCWSSVKDVNGHGLYDDFDGFCKCCIDPALNVLICEFRQRMGDRDFIAFTDPSGVFGDDEGAFTCAKATYGLVQVQARITEDQELFIEIAFLTSNKPE